VVVIPRLACFYNLDHLSALGERHFYEGATTMATQEANPSQGPDIQFVRLAEPFDLSEIKWRVTHTNKDGSRGAVIAFADPRAYTDRLNQLFTPTGWTRSYEVSTVSSVTRIKKDKLIQTGKVLVTCTLTINGLGCHAGSGEEWADEENAMTASEAQAFKRAASCFGLGRYLYKLSEVWVPLNEYRQPIEFPRLPDWALPKIDPDRALSSSGAKRGSIQHGPIDQRVTTKIEELRGIVGDPIFGEILWRIARARNANAIPNSQLQSNVAEAMERAFRGVRKARLVSESVSDTEVVSVLDCLQIQSMDAIPNLAALKELVRELERLAGSPAA
jgi:hypothetical protein